MTTRLTPRAPSGPGWAGWPIRSRCCAITSSMRWPSAALQPVAVHRRHRPYRRGGGQDRARAHGCAGPSFRSRQGGGPRRHAGLLARVRAGPGPGARRQAHRRHLHCDHRAGGAGAVPRRSSPGSSGATTVGPVLFRQTRVGLHGRTFEIIKFRSMEIGAETRVAELAARQRDRRSRLQAHQRSARHAARRQRLRRWSLDELPQLWNVLRGDMSLVGPRPPLESRSAATTCGIAAGCP